MDINRAVRRAVAVLTVVGVFVAGAVAGQAAFADDTDTEAVDCTAVLADIVEAVETTWSTASEAVDRAQRSVERPEVRECLEASA